MPKLRAARTKEEIEKVPQDQSVLIEVGEDNNSSEPEKKAEGGQVEREVEQAEGHETPNARSVAQQQRRAREREEREEGVDELSALQKRLEELERAETAQRNRAAEFERQMREQAALNQQLQEQVSQHKETSEDAQYTAILTGINAAEAEANAASQALEAAANAGDFKVMAEAQRKLARAEARLDRLEESKATYEERKERAPKEEQRRSPIVGDPFEQQIAAFPENARAWLRDHPEYIRNPIKNQQIQYLHLLVTQEEGKVPFSKDYFDSFETHLGLRKKDPPKVEADDEEEDDTPARTPVSAPVSREAPTPSGGRPSTTRITLSPQEREMARLAMPDKPPGEAERLYALGVLELRERKKNGLYSEGR